MGKIVKDKFPELDDEDQEAVRQHAIAALTLTQKAKEIASGGEGGEPTRNTALVDGVRKFAMDVRELDIDLIDRINPFGEAYAILAKTMSEDSLKQVAAAIAAKRTHADAGGGCELADARCGSSRSAAGCRPSPPRTPGRSAWPRAAAFLRASKARAGMAELHRPGRRARTSSRLRAPREGGPALAAGGAGHRRVRGHPAVRGAARPLPQHGEDRRHLRAALRRAPRPAARAGGLPRAARAPRPSGAAGRGAAAGLQADDWMTTPAGGLGVEGAAGRKRHPAAPRPHAARRSAADEIAERQKCEDFDRFGPLFDQVQDATRRRGRARRGRFWSAEVGDRRPAGSSSWAARRPTSRRWRALQRAERRNRRPAAGGVSTTGRRATCSCARCREALHKDAAGRRIAEPTAGPVVRGRTATTAIRRAAPFMCCAAGPTTRPSWRQPRRPAQDRRDRG